MIEWKPEDKVFLPSSYEEWKERIQYIKDVIRQIFIEYELIFDVEEDIVLNDVKLDFYLEKYKLGIKINDLISRNSTKEFWGLGKITDKTPYQEWLKTNELGIRVINAYEHEIFNEKKWQIFKNMLYCYI